MGTCVQTAHVSPTRVTYIDVSYSLFVRLCDTALKLLWRHALQRPCYVDAFSPAQAPAHAEGVCGQGLRVTLVVEAG